LTCDEHRKVDHPNWLAKSRVKMEADSMSPMCRLLLALVCFPIGKILVAEDLFQPASAPGIQLLRISMFNSNQPETNLLQRPNVATVGDHLILRSTTPTAPDTVFEWFFNREPIEGATNAMFAIDSVESSDEGTYSLGIKDMFGVSFSDEIQLLVSNVKASRCMSMSFSEPLGSPIQIKYTEDLGNGAWLVLTNTIVSTLPFVITDTGSAGKTTRFYKTSVSQKISAFIAPSWQFSSPPASLYKVEYADAMSDGWQPLTTVAVTNGLVSLVDVQATNKTERFYRTTLVKSGGAKRIGKVEFTVEWTFPPDVFTNLIQNFTDRIRSAGLIIDSVNHALMTTNHPLPGYWVSFGEQRVMTDTNGTFTLSLDGRTTEGYIAANYSARSTAAEGVFKIGDLAVPGEEDSKRIVAQFKHDAGLDMDSRHIDPLRQSGRTTAAEEIGTTCRDCRLLGNSEPCCLTHDGLIPSDCKIGGDGEQYDPDVLRAYIGSTCYNLVESGLCAREFNSHRTSLRIPGLSCWENHKYRNCQNISGLFNFSCQSTEIPTGGTADFRVFNDTWANETTLDFADGKVVGDLVWPYSAPGFWRLVHYDVDGDESVRKHRENLIFTFEDTRHTPPGTVLTFRAYAAGVLKQVSVQVGDSQQPVQVTSVTFKDLGSSKFEETVCFSPNANLITVPTGSTLSWTLSSGHSGTGAPFCFVAPTDGEYSGELTIQPIGAASQSIPFRFAVHAVMSAPSTVSRPCGGSLKVTAQGSFQLQGVSYSRLPFKGIVICTD
jgi:hypothetical protein